MVEDDWQAIGDSMRVTDSIVDGAPHDDGTLNALGHACLERTFCFRHREVFSLAGTLGVAEASLQAYKVGKTWTQSSARARKTDPKVRSRSRRRSRSKATMNKMTGLYTSST